MPRTNILLVAGVVLCAVVVGCSTPEVVKSRLEPAHIRGTVGQYAGYAGLPYRNVKGAGVVIMLGENGSTEVPSSLRRYLVQYLQRQNLGFYRYKTEHLHPDLILRDKDTAVVEISATIPYGAPVGSRFDLNVVATAQTRSLDGGFLMPSPLQLEVPGRGVPESDVNMWGEGAGSVFINPFADPTKAIELRNGKIIGGGTVTKLIPVSLVLGMSDPLRCRNIRDRINQRFRDRDDVAKAINQTIIELRIPPKYRHEPDHFLALVRHLPLVSVSAGVEMKTKEVLEAMYSPDAIHDELALVLEATGSRVIPMIQPEYSSSDPYVAYYCAQAGLRLGDAMAAAVVMQAAQRSGSPLQLGAIEELGRHPKLVEAVGVLRRLVDDKNLIIRVAASEALIRHGDSQTVRLIDIGGRFELALVRSTSGSPIIYASQTGRQRLLLLGDPIRIGKPVYYSPTDELVVIHDGETAEGQRLMVKRKLPRNGQLSETLKTGFTVASLVRTMGTPAEKSLSGNVEGLALTYGQVLRVLYGMCKSGHINAKFILERPGGSQIQRWSGGIERPDAADL